MQGVVYWQPPESAMNKVKEIIWEPSISKYGSDDGLPELREALFEKVFPWNIYALTLGQSDHAISSNHIGTTRILLLISYHLSKFY
jgi:hypothetical protein